MMRIQILKFIIAARLAWGRILDPAVIWKDLLRTTPPQKSVYKKALANWFFPN